MGTLHLAEHVGNRLIAKPSISSKEAGLIPWQLLGLTRFRTARAGGAIPFSSRHIACKRGDIIIAFPGRWLVNGLDVKNELLANKGWVDSLGATIIKDCISGALGGFSGAFLMRHHFGQAEEYYVIMVDGRSIVGLEVSAEGVVD